MKLLLDQRSLRTHIGAIWYHCKPSEITHSTNKIKTQYMRNPDMAYLLKMEYVSKINIFGLKMMVKSGLENNIFEIPPCARPLSDLVIYFIKVRN